MGLTIYKGGKFETLAAEALVLFVFFSIVAKAVKMFRVNSSSTATNQL